MKLGKVLAINSQTWQCSILSIDSSEKYDNIYIPINLSEVREGYKVVFDEETGIILAIVENNLVNNETEARKLLNNRDSTVPVDINARDLYRETTHGLFVISDILGIILKYLSSFINIKGNEISFLSESIKYLDKYKKEIFKMIVDSVNKTGELNFEFLKIKLYTDFKHKFNFDFDGIIFLDFNPEKMIFKIFNKEIYINNKSMIFKLFKYTLDIIFEELTIRANKINLNTSELNFNSAKLNVASMNVSETGVRKQEKFDNSYSLMSKHININATDGNSFTLGDIKLETTLSSIEIDKGVDIESKTLIDINGAAGVRLNKGSHVAVRGDNLYSLLQTLLSGLAAAASSNQISSASDKIAAAQDKLLSILSNKTFVD